MLDKIKEFQVSASSISAEAQDEITDSSKKELIEKIETLNQGIASMLSQMNDMYKSDYNTDVDISNSAKILQQVESVKQLQISKLGDLQNQLNKTRQIVSSQQNAADSNKYKPIKIYSSCIVSNADGSYST